MERLNFKCERLHPKTFGSVLFIIDKPLPGRPSNIPDRLFHLFGTGSVGVTRFLEEEGSVGGEFLKPAFRNPKSEIG